MSIFYCTTFLELNRSVRAKNRLMSLLFHTLFVSPNQIQIFSELNFEHSVVLLRSHSFLRHTTEMPHPMHVNRMTINCVLTGKKTPSHFARSLHKNRTLINSQLAVEGQVTCALTADVVILGHFSMMN